MTSAEISRKNMIDCQIKPNKVTDEALLDILGRTPRERFVPRHLQAMAYIDEDIPMGNGRYLPEPMVLARLIQEAAIKPTDIVLDVACGTGYSTAIMAQLAATVVGVEASKDMADEAERHLRDLDILNVAIIHQNDLRAGYPQQGPYQVILINGAADSIPQTLTSQLADGGRLLAIIKPAHSRIGQAVLVTRLGDNFVTRPLFDAGTPSLPGLSETAKFEF